MRWGMLTLFFVLFLSIASLIMIGVKKKKKAIWITGTVLAVLSLIAGIIIFVKYW